MIHPYWEAPNSHEAQRAEAIRIDVPWLFFCLAFMITAVSMFTGCFYLAVKVTQAILGGSYD
jgi:hypothetical protein